MRVTWRSEVTLVCMWKVRKSVAGEILVGIAVAAELQVRKSVAGELLVRIAVAAGLQVRRSVAGEILVGIAVAAGLQVRRSVAVEILVGIAVAAGLQLEVTLVKRETVATAEQVIVGRLPAQKIVQLEGTVAVGDMVVSPGQAS